jgi:predicted ATPase
MTWKGTMRSLQAASRCYERETQFIIATHSPILMAYPGAAIFSFDQVPIKSVAWESLDHVTLTRDFLISPSHFLRHL